MYDTFHKKILITYCTVTVPCIVLSYVDQTKENKQTKKYFLPSFNSLTYICVEYDRG